MALAVKPIVMLAPRLVGLEGTGGPEVAPVDGRTPACRCPLVCRQSHTPCSLLPDCVAARLPGTLRELEAVVVHAEQAASLIRAPTRCAATTSHCPARRCRHAALPST